MNIFDSKVYFVNNIIRTHGLETEDTSTGPTVEVVGVTIITHHKIRYVRLRTALRTVGVGLVSLTRYAMMIKCMIHSLGY